MNVDIALTVTDDKDLLCSRHIGQSLDVVCDVFGSDLSIAKTPSRRGNPRNVISRTELSEVSTVNSKEGLTPC